MTSLDIDTNLCHFISLLELQIWQDLVKMSSLFPGFAGQCRSAEKRDDIIGIAVLD
jgi:hypothetical protein